MSTHYEWAVVTPEGNNWSGIYSMGPGGPRYELQNGLDGKAEWPAPEGSYVARRVVIRGDWEPAVDDQLVPTSASAGRTDA